MWFASRIESSLKALKMLIKEYRIPLPLSVEEYKIAQLYMIAVSLINSYNLHYFNLSRARMFYYVSWLARNNLFTSNKMLEREIHSSKIFVNIALSDCCTWALLREPLFSSEDCSYLYPRQLMQIKYLQEQKDIIRIMVLPIFCFEYFISN